MGKERVTYKQKTEKIKRKEKVLLTSQGTERCEVRHDEALVNLILGRASPLQSTMIMSVPS